MSLKDQAQTVLQHQAQGPLTIDVAHDGQRLVCEISTLDTLSCAVDRFTLSTDKLAGATPPQLKKLAEKLAARLTYLLEPISPVELDAEQCVLQMRSNPPDRDQDRSSYYELVIRRGGDLSLCRWTKTLGNPRHTIPAHLTREVLWRLVNDFSEVAR